MSPTPTLPATPVSNPVAYDLIKPHVEAVLPGWRLLHGSMDQLNDELDVMKAGDRTIAVNDIVPVTFDLKKNAAVDVSFSAVLVVMIKSDVADSADTRVGYTREAVGAAASLLYQLQRYGNGVTVEGQVQGQVFINGFDANVDGVDFAVRLKVAAGLFNYCAVPIKPVV
jgi:hypothetical protein